MTAGSKQYLQWVLVVAKSYNTSLNGAWLTSKPIDNRTGMYADASACKLMIYNSTEPMSAVGGRSIMYTLTGGKKNAI